MIEFHNLLEMCMSLSMMGSIEGRVQRSAPKAPGMEEGDAGGPPIGACSCFINTNYFSIQIEKLQEVF